MTETIHPSAEPYERPRVPRDIPHLLVPEKRKISHWNDRHELRVNNWIEPWDFASPLDVGIIAVPFSKTSILPNGAYAAPNALRDAWAIFTTFTPDYRRRHLDAAGAGAGRCRRPRSWTCTPGLTTSRSRSRPA